MKPQDAIKTDIVDLDQSETYPENILPENVLCRYLYHPDEQYVDQKRWNTNFIWSKNTYKLDRIVEKAGDCVLYFLQIESDRAFVCKESMHIPEDT